jgi:protease-4
MAAMKNTTPFLLLACCAALAAGCGDSGGILIRSVPVDQRLKETVVQTDGGWISAKVALIDVDGLMINRRTGGWFVAGENPVSLLVEKLDKAKGDGNVKAVVLRINSPGGTVQASEAMHEALKRFRKDSGKPVIACITDVGASGAYYLACGADEIICQPSSITGSIGVVVQTLSFAGTMKMLGISSDAITSGPLKVMGSPLKDLTQEERKVFQAMVDEFYDRFVAVVAEGRKPLSAEKARALADGRVYTGRQALKLGLVDKLGDLQPAIADAKKAADVEKVKVVMYHRPLGYRANVYSSLAAPTPAMQINLLNLQGGELMLLRRPSFLYLWSTDLQPASRK